MRCLGLCLVGRERIGRCDAGRVSDGSADEGIDTPFVHILRRGDIQQRHGSVLVSRAVRLCCLEGHVGEATWLAVEDDFDFLATGSSFDRQRLDGTLGVVGLCGAGVDIEVTGDGRCLVLLVVGKGWHATRSVHAVTLAEFSSQDGLQVVLQRDGSVVFGHVVCDAGVDIGVEVGGDRYLGVIAVAAAHLTAEGGALQGLTVFVVVGHLGAVIDRPHTLIAPQVAVCRVLQLHLVGDGEFLSCWDCRQVRDVQLAVGRVVGIGRCLLGTAVETVFHGIGNQVDIVVERVEHLGVVRPCTLTAVVLQFDEVLERLSEVEDGGGRGLGDNQVRHLASDCHVHHERNDVRILGLDGDGRLIVRVGHGALRQFDVVGIVSERIETVRGMRHELAFVTHRRVEEVGCTAQFVQILLRSVVCLEGHVVGLGAHVAVDGGDADRSVDITCGIRREGHGLGHGGLVIASRTCRRCSVVEHELRGWVFRALVEEHEVPTRGRTGTAIEVTGDAAHAERTGALPCELGSHVGIRPVWLSVVGAGSRRSTVVEACHGMFDAVRSRDPDGFGPWVSRILIGAAPVEVRLRHRRTACRDHILGHLRRAVTLCGSGRRSARLGRVSGASFIRFIVVVHVIGSRADVSAASYIRFRYERRCADHDHLVVADHRHTCIVEHGIYRCRKEDCGCHEERHAFQ